MVGTGSGACFASSPQNRSLAVLPIDALIDTRCSVVLIQLAAEENPRRVGALTHSPQWIDGSDQCFRDKRGCVRMHKIVLRPLRRAWSMQH